MRLHVFLESADSGLNSYIGDARVPYTVIQAVRNVYAVGRSHHGLVDHNIGGRKADGLAQAVSHNHFSAYVIVPAQIFRALVHVACLNQTANKSGTYNVAVNHYRRNLINSKAVLLSKSFEHFIVSRRLMSESVIKPAKNFFCIEPVNQKFLNICLRLHGHYLLGKLYVKEIIHTELFDKSRLFILINNVFYRFLSRYKVLRQCGKCKDSTLQTFQASLFHRRLYKSLMTYMDPVKVSKSNAAGLNFFHFIYSIKTFHKYHSSH